MLGKFGKFTLVERIAEGGMAEVFKATVRGPEGFERIVAIKRLHRALCEDADLTQMLVDEARIAVQLNHPNIGNVFDLGCIENQYFIIMEYIDGTDMLHLLERTRHFGRSLPIPAALFSMSETLSALHYAHTKMSRDGEPLGIVHRDVSPQNMMVTWDGRVKLVDFGIAKARNRAQTTQHGIIKGKFYYMAPEQAHGHHVDARTDVYAAGMVLYESLAGQSPYEDVPETELLRHVRRADFPPPSSYRSDLDPELSALVEIATQRNPEKRFANAMEFQLALNDYRHRKLGAFAEPHMARTVAQIANASESDDNFHPMERDVYRPSEESLLFQKPDDAALSAAGGGSIGNGRDDNPFSDDLPTEIYDGNEPGDRPRRDLPPAPGGSRRSFEAPNQPGAGRNPTGSSPFGPPGSTGRVPNYAPQRARPHTKPSIVDRVAKPKYVYLAIGLVAVLVVGLGVALYFARQPADSEEGPGSKAAVTEVPEPATTGPPEVEEGPREVAVAFASEPPNAQVVIDDAERGSTPLSLELEAGKTYRVDFVKDGYQVDRQNVLVSEPSEVTSELVEARGILKVLSFPPDATVLINGEEQGTTPLTLTGLETNESYEVAVRLGEAEMSRTVEWSDEQQTVREAMFEFQKVDGEHLTLKVDDLPDKIERKKKKPRRRTYKRKRKPRRAKPKPKPVAESSSEDEDLDIFGNSKSSGSSSSSSSSSDDDDEFSVWGSSKKSGSEKKKKKTPKKTPQKKKKEDDDEDLSIW